MRGIVRSFSPDYSPFGANGSVAQMVERRTEDASVIGSSPVGAIFAGFIVQWQNLRLWSELRKFDSF